VQFTKHIPVQLTLHAWCAFLCRYKPELAQVITSSNVRDLMDAFQLQSLQSPSSSDELNKVCQDLLKQAIASDYCEPAQAGESGDNCGASKADAGDKSEIVLLNLRRFLESKQLPVGKNGFDKNLNLVAGNGLGCKCNIQVGHIYLITTNICSPFLGSLLHVIRET
jgi:hypothetical protein